MSQAPISTVDLVLLANESQRFITTSVRLAFQRAATREQQDFDRVAEDNIKALREEAVAARPSLRDEYKRLLCMSVLERTEHGLSVAMNDMQPEQARDLFARARMMDGLRNRSNEQRANMYEQAGAHHIAAILRQAA